jgi:hypothetical protein
VKHGRHGGSPRSEVPEVVVVVVVVVVIVIVIVIFPRCILPTGPFNCYARAEASK